MNRFVIILKCVVYPGLIRANIRFENNQGYSTTHSVSFWKILMVLRRAQAAQLVFYGKYVPFYGTFDLSSFRIIQLQLYTLMISSKTHLIHSYYDKNTIKIQLHFTYRD